MNHFASKSARIAATAALAAAAFTFVSSSFAAQPVGSPTSPVSSTQDAHELLARADQHAAMAQYSRDRACAEVGGKHAISWLTLANHCDQQARRTGWRQAGDELSRRTRMAGQHFGRRYWSDRAGLWQLRSFALRET